MRVGRPGRPHAREAEAAADGGAPAIHSGSTDPYEAKTHEVAPIGLIEETA